MLYREGKHRGEVLLRLAKSELECHRVTSEVGSLLVHLTGWSILPFPDSPVLSGVTVTLLRPCSKHLSSNTSTQRPLTNLVSPILSHKAGKQNSQPSFPCLLPQPGFISQGC